MVIIVADEKYKQLFIKPDSKNYSYKGFDIPGKGRLIVRTDKHCGISYVEGFVVGSEKHGSGTADFKLRLDTLEEEPIILECLRKKNYEGNIEFPNTEQERRQRENERKESDGQRKKLARENAEDTQQYQYMSPEERQRYETGWRMFVRKGRRIWYYPGSGDKL